MINSNIAKNISQHMVQYNGIPQVSLTLKSFFPSSSLRTKTVHSLQINICNESSITHSDYNYIFAIMREWLMSNCDDFMSLSHVL